ncbi:MAG TPA: hypothetical protein VFQ46_01145 [Candidatus Limnocylindria bacterium]|nr:hypothetical protein [Candidatus Limnocylindria bacterium]
MEPSLAAVHRWLPFVVLVVLGGQSFFTLANYQDAPAVWLVWLVALPLTLRWPVPTIIAASVILRLGFADRCCADQIIVSQSAWERVLSGQGPYGVGYASTIPPGAPFPYGPLAVIWWVPGPVMEFAAALGIMGILAWQRGLATLAVFGLWQASIRPQWVGVNDYSPGLLILIALLLLRSRPLVGAIVLSVAAALKPYAAAWFLPAIGFGGWGVAAVLAGATAVLWSPLLWWGGPAAYLESVRLAAAVHHEQRDALNLPLLRWLAVPIAIAGLWVRRWEWAVLVGSAVFAIFLFLDFWASYSYWLAVLPISGLALESLARAAYRHAPSDDLVAPPDREARAGGQAAGS